MLPRIQVAGFLLGALRLLGEELSAKRASW